MHIRQAKPRKIKNKGDQLTKHTKSYIRCNLCNNRCILNLKDMFMIIQNQDNQQIILNTKTLSLFTNYSSFFF